MRRHPVYRLYAWVLAIGGVLLLVLLMRLLAG